MDVIILAGGKGTRMEDSVPKALILVKNKPILDYQLDYFKDHRIILALGFESEKTIAHVRSMYPERNIVFSVEEKLLGTGGALKQALSKAESDFVVVLNCDDLTDIDLNELEKIKENTICCAHPRLPFGVVNEKDGFAVFEEKPVLDGWVSCGWYVFNKKKLLDLLPDEGSLEYDVFPRLKLRVYKHNGVWRTFNSKKDIEEFEKE